MTQIIYIVRGSCGSYEDYSEWDVKGFFDPEKAKHRMWQEQENLKELVRLTELGRNIYQEWCKTHPRPVCADLVKIPNIPQGVKKKDWPKDFVERQNAAREENRKISEAYTKEMGEWWEAGKVDVLAELRKHCEDEELLARLNLPHCGYADPETTYEIVELEVE